MSRLIPLVNNSTYTRELYYELTPINKVEIIGDVWASKSVKVLINNDINRILRTIGVNPVSTGVDIVLDLYDNDIIKKGMIIDGKFIVELYNFKDKPQRKIIFTLKSFSQVKSNDSSSSTLG